MGWLKYKWLPNFKALLFLLAIAIIIGVELYTNSIVQHLRESSRRYLTLQVDRFRLLFTQGDATALEQYLDEMSKKDFPLIVADMDGNPISWSGMPQLDKLPELQAIERARKYQQEWVNVGNEPVPIDIPEYSLKYYFYYGDSEYVRRLQLMPWIEILLVGSLIFLGYLGFTSIKKSEERFVWVGMAREAAHQLGTPLTSLLGWLELLSINPADPKIPIEMRNDLERLREVAERFNKIGSNPPVVAENLKEIIETSVDYIRRRLPQMGGNEVHIHLQVPGGLIIPLNSTLFKWVIENLLKNAVESLKGKAGTLSIVAEQSGNHFTIDITDTGCGIPRREWKDVFRPGFTTKKRGWGLGLSLTKRIIEEVHRGQIFIADSSPTSGTTVRILLKV